MISGISNFHSEMR